MKTIWIVALIGIGSQVFGQISVRFKDVAWREDAKSTVVPEEWLDREVVCLDRIFTYKLENAFGPADRQSAELYMKLSLRSQQAVDHYRYIPVPNVHGAEVSALDCRITKLDGRIIDVRSRFLKRHEVKDRLNGSRADAEYRYFDVPMLEPGDQLEYVIRFINFPFPERVYFHSDIAIVNSVYKLIAMTRFDVLTSEEMGAPSPEEFEEFYNVHRIYTMKNLEPIREEPGMRFHESYPHIRNVVVPSFIEDNFWPQEWGSFYREIDQIQYQLNRNYDARMEETLRQIWDSIPTGAQYEKIRAFHHFVNRQMNVVKRNPNQPVSFGNDMRYRQTTERNLLLMYDDVFRRFDLKYFMIWAPDKNKGDLDTTLLSARVVPNRFFAVIVGSDTVFITPRTESVTFSINDVPPSACGTHAIWFNNDDLFNHLILPIYCPANESVRKVSLDLTSRFEDNLLTQEFINGSYKYDFSPLLFNRSIREATFWDWFSPFPDNSNSAEIQRVSSPSDSILRLEYITRVEGSEIKLAELIHPWVIQVIPLGGSPRKHDFYHPLQGVEEFEIILSETQTFSGNDFVLKGDFGSFECRVEKSPSGTAILIRLVTETDKLNPEEFADWVGFLSEIQAFLSREMIWLN